MRPNKFYREVEKAIHFWLKTKSTEKFTPYLVKRMERQQRRCAKESNDYRELAEVGGYDFSNEERIHYTMMYISDRFNNAYRLKWLLAGLKEGYL